MRKLRTDGRWFDRLGVAFLAIALGSIALWATARPIFNWDMLPYVAIASETPSMDPSARHARAYRLVAAVAPEQDWDLLTQSSAYRIRMFSDASAFDSQLGLYRFKAAYTFAGRALGTLMPVPAAFRALNLISLATLFIAMAWWMTKGGFGRSAFLAVPMFMLAGLPEAARMVTPDVPCAAFALAGLALIRRDRWLPAALCFAAATATRPDFVLFPVGLAAVALPARQFTRESVACLAASVASYGLAMLIGDHPGWWPHFSAALLERNDGFDAAAPFSLEAYVSAVRSAWWASVTARNWPYLAVLLCGTWLMLMDRPVRRLRQADLLVAGLIVSLAAHCLVFPLPHERLYLPALMMLTMLAAERWGEWVSRSTGRLELGGQVDDRPPT